MGFDFLVQEAFSERLQLEVRRTERSRRPLVLLLIDGVDRALAAGEPCRKLMCALSNSTRLTDIRGWHKSGSCLGIIFTELGNGEIGAISEILREKIASVLSRNLTPQQMDNLVITLYNFPEDQENKGEPSAIERLFDADLVGAPQRRKMSLMLKRLVDIAGSLCALILASPVLLLIAVVIRLTSEGPILFRQPRVGRKGKEFPFLKFRSMYASNDPAIHQDYVAKLIKGNANRVPLAGGDKAVYKLANDPRITPFGRFLRRTSLDEFPQFLNVLRGEMSLVGPRPPIPYEVKMYDFWHRHRLSVKPGITGLWQVTARSRTTFDEMVRLDLQYAKSSSFWLDLRILLQTPRAVLTGSGAH